MWKEFKEFALKGNLVEMAIAFVMGGAFGKLASSFVDGMVAPMIGLLLGGEDLTKLKWVLSPEILDEAGKVSKAESAILYGSFLTAAIDFFIVALVMFLIVKGINAANKKQEEAPAAPAPPPVDVQLLTEIRDLLKKG